MDKKKSASAGISYERDVERLFELNTEDNTEKPKERHDEPSKSEPSKKKKK